MITNNKLRNALFGLMYIVFMVLWADSLVDQDRALEVIAKHEKTLDDIRTQLNKMGDMYHVLYTRDMDLTRKYDSLSRIMKVKDNYINGFGYKIDWVKALEIYESNTDIQTHNKQ